MPLAFTKNDGQWPDKVQFRANAGGAAMWFTQNGAVYQFTRHIPKDDEDHDDSMNPTLHFVNHGPDSIESMAIRASFIGANSNPQMVGSELMEYKCNYFIGNDPNKWHTDVPNYDGIIYKEIYTGIDLKYYGNGKQMEYDFIVSPGANPSQIDIHYAGAESLSVNGDGELVIGTKWGEIIEKKPIIFQIQNGARNTIEGEYMLNGADSFGFLLKSNYDPTLPLVIDPVLTYSTYLGGSDTENASDIAVDISGNAYITGYTRSSDFPTEEGYQTYLRGDCDVFVTKLNTAGNSLVYSTYFGGSGYSEDYGNGIAVDNSGNAFITGKTEASDFPVEGEFQTFQGASDAFVTKLNSSGNDLIYSTCLGGAGADVGNAIAIDDSGNAYITGRTGYSDFPTEGEYQTYQGGYDAFVTKLNIAGNNLVYSTYIGGSGWDASYGITVNNSGNAYITGRTGYSDFPTEGEYQTYQGGYDAFVTKLNIAGNDLVYSTYLGGSGDDESYGLSVDGSGNAYIAGMTMSSDFPTEGEYQTYQGYMNAFVTKLYTTGDSLVYSTYLGGSSSYTRAQDIDLDSLSNAYITGWTAAVNFPTEGEFQTFQGASDAFVTKLNSSGNDLIYSTYLGGSDYDRGIGISVDGSGNAYIAGRTSSNDFPTMGAYQNTQYGNGDVFIAKIGEASDIDDDWIADDVDNCPNVQNSDQDNSDVDSYGNACDNCPYDYNPNQTDTDGDGLGDACDGCIDEEGNHCSNHVWAASSGQLPEDICPQWELINDADIEQPFFDDDSLVISTSIQSENMWYRSMSPLIEFPDTLIVETRMRLASGFSNTSYHAPSQIGIGPGNNLANTLWIGIDEVFLWSDIDVKGPSIAIDTDDDFHTYRIMVIDADSIFVYYDNTHILTGNIIENATFPLLSYLYFGQSTYSAYGTSKWLYFKHNAYAFDTDYDQDGIYDSCDNCIDTHNPNQTDTDGDGMGDVCDGCIDEEGDYCSNHVWEASLGYFPDEICPGYIYYTSGSPTAPVFEGDTLILATSGDAEFSCYQLSNPEFIFPETLSIEFNMRYISGNMGSGRTSCFVWFKPGPNYGNILFIGVDQIYVWSSYGGIGNSISVDTDDYFHKYRIEVADSSDIVIYYDNDPILTGSVFYSTSWSWGGDHSIGFGDRTPQASGISRWFSFKHNAYAFAQDYDGDGITDSCDNCPETYNPTQVDTDGDGTGDLCDGPITVTSLDDSGVGTLRWALDSAENDPGENYIDFSVSGTIEPLDPLPLIKFGGPVHIYGSSAPGKAGSITIDGINQGGGSAFLIRSGNNLIEGFNFLNFSPAIYITDPGADSNVIINNTFSDCGAGITLTDTTKFNRIGGYGTTDKNIFTGNYQALKITHSDSNSIIGNQIGGAFGNPDDGNSNDGIELYEGHGNLIDSNIIGYNGEYGIQINGDPGKCMYNTVTRNRIFANGEIGIDLHLNGDTPGLTVNDIGDLDTGPNDLLNYPEIDSVRMNPDSTFNIYGRAVAGGRVEIFLAHPAKDTSMPVDPTDHGEAFDYIGFTTCDVGGDFVFSIDEYISFYSMLTSTVADASGNTSEFSENFMLAPAPLIIEAFSPINLWVTDPEGYYIGRNAAGDLSQTIFPATYDDIDHDSINIATPIPGDYLIEIIGEEGAPPDGVYSIGITIDGSLMCIPVYQADAPMSGAIDTLYQGIEEWGVYVNGDPSGNETINILDITFLINYLYKDGPIPVPEAAGDADCNSAINILDVTYLINYLYKDGNVPCFIE